MKKIIAPLLAALTLLPLLCGCGGGETARELTAVRLNEVTHSVFYAPQYVAMELGFFEEEGLAIQLTNGGGADKVMTAVVSGQSDIGLAGPESCIYIYNQGKEDHPVVFGQLTACDGAFLMGREDVTFDWEQLRGKTIIGGRKGGVPEMTLEYVLRQHGLEPQVDVTVDTSVQFNMMAGAFTGGQGDYVTLFEPAATQVAAAGEGYILCSIGSQSYTATNPAVIAAFCRAVARALDWVDTHTDREVAQAIIGQFPDTDLDTLEAVTARHREIGAWNMPLTMEKTALERLETVMTQAGELTEADWVDFDRLVDNRWAQAAR